VNLLIRYSLNNIWKDKVIFLLIILSMAAGVLAYIVFPKTARLALMSIKNYGFEDSVLVMEKDNLKLAFSRVDEELYQFVKTAPHVKTIGQDVMVAPYLQMSSIFGDQFIMLRGITDVFYKIRGDTFRFFSGRELREKYDILIGHLTAKRLGDAYKVGDVIPLENRKWKIVGIFKADGDPVESGAMVRMEDFKEVSARGTYSFIEIKADSPKNIPKLTGYVNMAFKALHDEFPDSPAIMAMPEKQYWLKLASMFNMDMMVNRARAYVACICVLLFLINLSNSALKNRIDDIRILRRSGFKKRIIALLMAIELLTLSSIGGCLGGVISVALNGIIVTLQMATVTLKIEPFAVIQGMILAIILVTLASVLPIIKTLRRLS